MKHTKDEIEIQVTKKDRIYLSIILSLILVVALVCILVPRYYYLQNKDTPAISANGNLSNDNSTTPEQSSSAQDNTNGNSINYLYKNYYSTLVINSLKDLGMPYSTLANHLDSYEILDVLGIGITTSELENLESLALPIYSELQKYIEDNITITADIIDSNNSLHSQIVAFSNTLNQISEN